MDAEGIEQSPKRREAYAGLAVYGENVFEAIAFNVWTYREAIGIVSERSVRRWTQQWAEEAMDVIKGNKTFTISPDREGADEIKEIASYLRDISELRGAEKPAVREVVRERMALEELRRDKDARFRSLPLKPAFMVLKELVATTTGVKSGRASVNDRSRR